MARKRRHEEHDNHERWLISYADFITLLFAFFVVMYSISSINEGKYRVLSDSLLNAFRMPPKALDPIQVGQPAKTSVPPNMNFVQRPNVLHAPQIALLPQDDGGRRGIDNEDLMGRIADQLRSALAELMDRGLISVRSNPLWLEVEIKDSVLFPSGSAALQPAALPVLRAVAEVLREHPNSIRVEGFTDDKPIDTLLYPSNWELSTTRAASVVRLLAREGVAPVRLSAQGHAEFRPVADNATEEGRARNRRVVLVVLADDSLSNMLDARERDARMPADGPSAAPGASNAPSFPQSAVPLTGSRRGAAAESAQTSSSPETAGPADTERQGFENGFELAPAQAPAPAPGMAIEPISVAPPLMPIRSLFTLPTDTLASQPRVTEAQPPPRNGE